MNFFLQAMLKVQMTAFSAVLQQPKILHDASNWIFLKARRNLIFIVQTQDIRVMKHFSYITDGENE
jgi:hypothetical protein